jgi:hypothetical protein
MVVHSRRACLPLALIVLVRAPREPLLERGKWVWRL